MNELLLTPREVAERARRSYHTVLRAIRRGDLRAVRPRGSNRLSVPESAVAEWLEPVTPDRPVPDLEPRPRSRPVAPAGSFRDRVKVIDGGGSV